MGESPQVTDHDWFFPKFVGHWCCRKCGVIQRRDGKNNPCRGVVRVVLREQDADSQSHPSGDVKNTAPEAVRSGGGEP